jgi:hypothetical protein
MQATRLYLTHVVGTEETDCDKYSVQARVNKRLELRTDILWS